ncbi:MAG: hypothetical protein J2P48_11675 [Alphaproteobacteria bacterium]|nr:hypothetical protein [Alphaproteobacteria bacterium]
MQTPAEYRQQATTLLRAKRAATSDEAAVLAGRAWSRCLLASRHAMLAERFDRMSEDERQLAASLATMPGGGTAAERARVTAGHLTQVADRHRRKAEEKEAEGAQLQSEAASIQRRNGSPQPPQRPQPPLRQQSPQTPPRATSVPETASNG